VAAAAVASGVVGLNTTAAAGDLAEASGRIPSAGANGDAFDLAAAAERFARTMGATATIPVVITVVSWWLLRPRQPAN
jgi:hypothetical protein